MDARYEVKQNYILNLQRAASNEHAHNGVVDCRES